MVSGLVLLFFIQYYNIKMINGKILGLTFSNVRGSEISEMHIISWKKCF